MPIVGPVDEGLNDVSSLCQFVLPGLLAMRKWYFHNLKN